MIKWSEQIESIDLRLEALRVIAEQLCETKDCLKRIAGLLEDTNSHLRTINSKSQFLSFAAPEEKANPEPVETAPAPPVVKEAPAKVEEAPACIEAKPEVKPKVAEPEKTKYRIYRKTSKGDTLNEYFDLSARNDDEAIELAEEEATKRGWGGKNWTGDKIK